MLLSVRLTHNFDEVTSFDILEWRRVIVEFPVLAQGFLSNASHLSLEQNRNKDMHVLYFIS